MPAHPPSVFCVSETEAATIHTTLDQEGELSAAVELRRLFPDVADMVKAREMARVIAGWAAPLCQPPSCP